MTILRKKCLPIAHSIRRPMYKNDRGTYIQDPESGIVYVQYIPKIYNDAFLPLCIFKAPHNNLLKVEWLVEDTLAEYNLAGVKGLLGLSDE